MINSFQLLTIFEKNSILDVWEGVSTPLHHTDRLDFYNVCAIR